MRTPRAPWRRTSPRSGRKRLDELYPADRVHPADKDYPADVSQPKTPFRPKAARQGWPIGVLVPLGILALALIVRLNALWCGFITPDEPIWVFRSWRFVQALAEQRWGDTFQIGHPGVVTMWMGALGLWWSRWRDAAAAATHLAWVDRVAWVTPTNGELFRHLAPFMPPARMAMALLNALGVVGVYALAGRLWDRRLAVAGALLLALDPFAAGLSGLLHVDAPQATFMMLSMLAWLNALTAVERQPQAAPPAATGVGSSVPLPAERGPAQPTSPARAGISAGLFAFLSGLCGGLSVLSKSPGIFIVAAVGASALLFWLQPRARSWRRLGGIALLGLVWIAGAAAALFGAFPAMWVDPLGVLRGIYSLADRHLDMPHRISFFRGVSGSDPGPLFYPAVLLFRLTPITLAGLALSLLPLLRKRTPAQHRAALLSLWVLALGFMAFVTVGAKKFDRYLLPAFPPLDLLAAVGWIEAARGLYGRIRRGAAESRALPARAAAAILSALAVAQGAMILSGWPYALDAYNPLVGGMGAALRTLPVGWGEGVERAAAVLAKPSWAAGAPAAAGALVVAGASPVTLSPLLDGTVLPLDPWARQVADVLIVTAADRQIYPERVARIVSGASLIYALRVGGQEVLWLYRVTEQAEAEHLARYGAPGDIILCDAASPFARRAAAGAYPEWNVYALTDADEREVVELLNRWTVAHTRLWYLSYGDPASVSAEELCPPSALYPLCSPITAAALRRQLDAYAVPLDDVDLGYARARLYILPEEPLFEVGAAGGELAEAVNFGGRLSIVGGVVCAQREPAGAGQGSVGQVAADEGVTFRLRWEAASAPLPDVAPFVHLVDAAGHMRKAGRGEEVLTDARDWPTSAWAAGDRAECNYGMGLPVGLPPGRYTLVVGLSDVHDGGWLPVLDRQGRVAGATAPVLAVDVLPAGEPPDPAALHMPHAADYTWADQIRLLGYDYSLQASVGQTVIVDLGWLGLAPFDGDWRVRLSLVPVGAVGGPALEQTFDLSGYPTSRWRAGEVIRDLFDLRLPAELQGGAYQVCLEVLDASGVSQGPPAALGEIEISAGERLFELPQPPQQPLNLRLGSGITLLGYDLPSPAVRAGDELTLTLYWRCEAPLETSYTAFVHLLDAQGRVQGQRDQIPVRGRAPTSSWMVGQIVVDEYRVPLSPDVPPGPHRLEVGMYDARNMVRLPVVDAQGRRLSDDRVLLDESLIVLAGEAGR